MSHLIFMILTVITNSDIRDAAFFNKIAFPPVGVSGH